jgi:hypothetical protein
VCGVYGGLYAILHSDTFQASSRGQIKQYTTHKSCNQSI